MGITIADLDLCSELERARKNNGNLTQKISLAQALAMRDGGTPAKAVQELISGVVKLVNVGPVHIIDSSHPLISALSILISHPEADWNMMAGIEEQRKAIVESAVKEHKQEWSAEKLEWQLVIYVTAVGINTPVDLQRTLAGQEFDDQHVQDSWDVMLQLNMLRTLNRL